MREDSVMALGALRLPNTSGPVPLKSNTALPCPPGGEVVSPKAALPPTSHSPLPSPRSPQPDLTQVYMHAKSDGGAVIHVVLCGDLQREAPGLPGGPKGPEHVPNGQLSVCLAGIVFRGSHGAFWEGQEPPSPTCPAAWELAQSHPHALAPGPPEYGPCRPAPHPDRTAR